MRKSEKRIKTRKNDRRTCKIVFCITLALVQFLNATNVAGTEARLLPDRPDHHTRLLRLYRRRHAILQRIMGFHLCAYTSRYNLLTDGANKALLCLNISSVEKDKCDLRFSRQVAVSALLHREVRKHLTDVSEVIAASVISYGDETEMVMKLR